MDIRLFNKDLPLYTDMYEKVLGTSLFETRRQELVQLLARNSVGAFGMQDCVELKSKPFVCIIRGLGFAKEGMVNASTSMILRR